MGGALIVMSSAGFASLSILGKLAYRAGFTLTGMLALRFLGAALLLALLVGLRRRGTPAPGARQIPALLALGGLLYAGQSALFFGALQRLPASVIAFLLYTYPLYVALFDWLVNRRAPGPRELVALPLTLAGILLIADPGWLRPAGAPPSLDPGGVLMILASAGGYAAYILLSARASRGLPWTVSTLWVVLGTGISFSLAGLATGGWQMDLSPEAPWILLGMVLFSTVVGLGLFLAGLARVGPTPAALLATTEPLFTLLLAAWILGEGLGPLQALGCLAVLAAVLLLQPRRRTGPSHNYDK